MEYAITNHSKRSHQRKEELEEEKIQGNNRACQRSISAS